MIKIDIISLTGLTAVDGSVVASGATMRFESVFYNGSNLINIRLKVYRSRELFEAGYENVRVIELPHDFDLNIPDEEYYVLTPQILYEKVMEKLNELLGGIYFEIKITINDPETPEEE